MPSDLDVSFLAVDEIQLCADPERGHVFTDRLLHARGRDETMFLGADTIRPLLKLLVPEAEVVTRPRFSTLTYTAPAKVTRLPRRSAVVAFTAQEVYALAELIRRRRGGAAVVLGALSPRTRNAQVALYQAGEVDYLIATDAIGMGLNMDLRHVALASLDKFDGRERRPLHAHEIAQIAGRAGRHMQDGTFGTTQDVGGLDARIVEAVETHSFPALRQLHWRNARARFRLAAGAAGFARRAAALALPGAHRRRARPCEPEDPGAPGRDPRARDLARRRAPLVVGLPDPGFPQDPDRRPPQPARHGVREPRAARPPADRLGRRPDCAARTHRRRHRRADHAARPHPHLDLRRLSLGLAGFVRATGRSGRAPSRTS